MALLAGNWKLFKTRPDVEAFFKELEGLEIPASHKCAVAPSPVLLETAVRSAKNTQSAIQILSQNIAYKSEGAFTGEIGVKQLLELGVSGTLVAHSERRQFFGETDATAAERCKIALENGLDVLFCIGENLEERRHGRFESVCESQLEEVLKVAGQFPKSMMTEKLIIAYEPVWAIGTGVTANNQEIQDSHSFIHSFNLKAGYDLKILYGGSVKPDNFGAISKTPHVSGALVGGASLEAKSYKALLECLTRPLSSVNS